MKSKKDPVAQSTSVYSTTSAADFSMCKETLVVKEEETYDAGVFFSYFLFFSNKFINENI